MENFIVPDESDGETAIKNALLKLGIKFEQEAKIIELKGDTKSFRRADFHLPEYGVFIEFFGGWDSPTPEKRAEERKRYIEKKQIYEKNNVPCIYVYPNQLHYARHVIKKNLESFGVVITDNPISTIGRISLWARTFYKFFYYLFFYLIFFVLIAGTIGGIGMVILYLAGYQIEAANQFPYMFLTILLALLPFIALFSATGYYFYKNKQVQSRTKIMFSMQDCFKLGFKFWKSKLNFFISKVVKD